jgi:ankyrin repeat protein
LWCAVDCYHWDLFQQILEHHKFDAHKIESPKGTPFFEYCFECAVKNNKSANIKILSYLCKVSPPLPKPIGLTHWACSSGDLQLLEDSLVGVDVTQKINSKDDNGYNCVHVAIMNKRMKIVERLIQLGADVHAVTSSGSNYFHLCFSATQAHEIPWLVQVLQARKIDKKDLTLLMTSKDKSGISPFQLSIHENHLNLVEEFMSLGLKELGESRNFHLLQLSVSQGLDHVKKIVECGFDLQTPNLMPWYWKSGKIDKDVLMFLLQNAPKCGEELEAAMAAWGLKVRKRKKIFDSFVEWSRVCSKDTIRKWI